MSKLKLPWVNWNCREQIEITVNKLKLPWVSWNCRERIEIAKSKIEIALSKLELPWHFWATVFISLVQVSHHENCLTNLYLISLYCIKVPQTSSTLSLSLLYFFLLNFSTSMKEKFILPMMKIMTAPGGILLSSKNVASSARKKHLQWQR